MPALRNSKQEIYVQNWFKGESKEQSAITAGYQPKWARSIGSRLSTNVNIITRYNELQKKAEDASVATVLERKQILTEIARGNLLDYQEVGADGSYLNIDKDKPNTRAISEITSRTEYNKDGANAALITKVKLHSSAQAIDLLNKMDKLYEDGFTDGKPVQVHVNVINFNANTVAAAIIEAEQLGISPELLGGNGHGEDAALLSSPTDVQATPIPESKD